MDNKLYAGNLPDSMRDTDLRQHVTQFGELIAAKVMLESDRDCAKGFVSGEMNLRGERSGGFGSGNHGGNHRY